MYELKLNMYQATAIAAVVLLLGRFLVNHISFLKKYCIPEPVAGGVVFALVHLALRQAGIIEISFDGTLQTFFMTVFFCSVGYTACFRLLKKGGIQLILFLAVSIIMVILQDILGAGLASVFGLDPRLGLAAGSIPMVGGHGTAAAWGPKLEEMGVAGANVVALASATFGLVAGCLIGGPIAYKRITKHNLHSVENVNTTTTTTITSTPTEQIAGTIDSKKFLDASLYLAIAIGLGTIISTLLGNISDKIVFPSYIGAMVAAAIIRNVADGTSKDVPMEEINTIGGFCLSLFLGLAMMGMKLWQLADLALPLVVMLLGQTVLMAFFAYFIVFNLLGKNYDAAVMATGFCGFGMGATPNAMANMQSVIKKYGPAPTAYFIVPLVGSLFIDFINNGLLSAFASFLS